MNNKPTEYKGNVREEAAQYQIEIDDGVQVSLDDASADQLMIAFEILRDRIDQLVLEQTIILEKMHAYLRAADSLDRVSEEPAEYEVKAPAGAYMTEEMLTAVIELIDQAETGLRNIAVRKGEDIDHCLIRQADVTDRCELLRREIMALHLDALQERAVRICFEIGRAKGTLPSDDLRHAIDDDQIKLAIIEARGHPTVLMPAVRAMLDDNPEMTAADVVAMLRDDPAYSGSFRASSHSGSGAPMPKRKADMTDADKYRYQQASEMIADFQKQPKCRSCGAVLRGDGGESDGQCGACHRPKVSEPAAPPYRSTRTIRRLIAEADDSEPTLHDVQELMNWYAESLDHIQHMDGAVLQVPVFGEQIEMKPHPLPEYTEEQRMLNQYLQEAVHVVLGYLHSSPGWYEEHHGMEHRNPMMVFSLVCLFDDLCARVGWDFDWLHDIEDAERKEHEAMEKMTDEQIEQHMKQTCDNILTGRTPGNIKSVKEPDAPLYFRKPSGRYRVAEPAEVLELAAQMVRPERGDAIRSPDDTAKFLRLKLAHLEHESFCIVFLDNRHRVIDFVEMFRGTIDGTSVYPREVVKEALRRNAAAIILAHNHPSGIAEPSQADERITKRLKSACELIDVRVLDHIIVAGDDSVSLASRGVI